MSTVRFILISLLVAAPAAAGTSAPARHTIVVRRAPDRTVVLVDGKPAPRIRRVKLARTPPPRCTKDRRGAIRCELTY